MAKPNSPQSMAPVIPHPSATVILVRPAASDFEIFMVRRSAEQSFGNVYVFPGGVVRPDDAAEISTDRDFSAADALSALTVRGGRPPSDARQALAIWRAALRELFEEAGVLLATTAEGQPLTMLPAVAERFAQARPALQAGQLSLGELVAREQLSLSYRGLTYFSHWITPAPLPRRYDTRFFVARMPEGQDALHCQIETTDGRWIRPADALAGAADGTFPAVFPTRMHLARLSQYASIESLLDFAASKSIRTVELAQPPADERRVSVGDQEVDECW
ncbi:MAG TPA: NUDIX hydrolase [Chloroflexota bacterium]|nr:NUDIX hydrolase [Chloroflexota bacterium]